jgi:uncharacterized protein (DUF1810 family)
MDNERNDGMEDPYNLERFVEAQERALGEIRRGRKDSHWIWWTFPQFAGLGFSGLSREYSISSMEEAQAYLRHPVLGPRLHEITTAMNSQSDRQIASIVGADDVKFRSSMTLFMRAAPGDSAFQDALELFFNGEPDIRTDQLLRGCD